MPNKRPVFFVSDSTAITAETLGHSLLTQFGDVLFDELSLRYVNTPQRALEAQAAINAARARSGLRPLVFSTLVLPDLREIIAASDGVFIDFMAQFVAPLEQELGTRARPNVGYSHGMVLEGGYDRRMDAVNFALQNDDGGRVRQYDRADLILVGVSRSGKTPTSVFLAIHYGVFVANYPLVDAELESARLPVDLLPYRDKLFGLSIRPERLQQIRRERSPHSRYATLHQCQYEVRQVEALFRSNRIPWLDVTSKSVEEISASILSITGLDHHRLHGGA